MAGHRGRRGREKVTAVTLIRDVAVKCNLKSQVSRALSSAVYNALQVQLKRRQKF